MDERGSVYPRRVQGPTLRRIALTYYFEYT